ncbi:hypothetical protein [Crocinitomix catalasitica]|uniref:hypothetical protein n=1 Tax=Crocinitomix catalasitica TaxID=184607 RepID=UPI000480C8C0|nr:hypothetical protein [Crocinitomix catalasitica]
MGEITIIDWAIWLVYFTLIFLVLFIYRANKSEKYYRYFLPGFTSKVFGGLMFTLIYVYYYKFGDTFLYFRGANVLSQTFIDHPIDYFRLLFSSHKNLPLDLDQITSNISYSRGAEEWFMVKLLSPFVLLSFQSYLVTTLLLSTIAFFGAWKLYKVFVDVMPKQDILNFIAVFLLPSVVFWGSGIMKDTFTLAGINLIIYICYFTFFKYKWSFLKFSILVFACFLVYKLKDYVLIAFIPGLLFGLTAAFKDRIHNKVLRKLLGLTLVIITGFILYVSTVIVAELSSSYTYNAVKGKVKGFHSWHTDIGGSTYDLGVADYSLTGVVQKIPAALNATYFRPYLWEASNPVVLLAAIESTFVFLLFVYLIFKLRGKFFRLIFGRPLLTTITVYILLFGFIVGFTSYNFGALGRYKIPTTSLFIFLLLYLYSYKFEKKSID